MDENPGQEIKEEEVLGLGQPRLSDPPAQYPSHPHTPPSLIYSLPEFHEIQNSNRKFQDNALLLKLRFPSTELYQRERGRGGVM
jgi:hypothetical protein